MVDALSLSAFTTLCKGRMRLARREKEKDTQRGVKEGENWKQQLRVIEKREERLPERRINLAAFRAT